MTTPDAITDSVMRLRDRIGVTSEAVFVRVSPIQVASSLECHANVSEYVNHHGGTRVSGWCVWEHPGFIVEGVFHSVWRSPSGELTDITPQRDGEPRILFIPDSRRVPDGSPVDSVRVPLIDSAEARHTIRIQEALFALRVRHANQVPAPAFLEAVAAATLPTDACPCLSGRPFRDCHRGAPLSEQLQAWGHLVG